MPGKIKNLSPWSYPDAAAAGAADAASAVCILSCTYLRVLGSPNPGQSFRRGLWGPVATEVCIARA